MGRGPAHLCIWRPHTCTFCHWAYLDLHILVPLTVSDVSDVSKRTGWQHLKQPESVNGICSCRCQAYSASCGTRYRLGADLQRNISMRSLTLDLWLVTIPDKWADVANMLLVKTTRNRQQCTDNAFFAMSTCTELRGGVDARLVKGKLGPNTAACDVGCHLLGGHCCRRSLYGKNQSLRGVQNHDIGLKGVKHGCRIGEM